MPRSVALLATLDTKGKEAAYLAERIRDAGVPVVLVNTGLADSSDYPADFGVADVAAASMAIGQPGDSSKIRIMNRSASGARAVLESLLADDVIGGVIAIGGGQGSWIASTAMRSLPVGLAKVLVSTAGRDAGQFTQFSDIVSFFSITDVAGLNPLLRRVLDNAAAAIAGMSQVEPSANDAGIELIAVSVYGITTAGATVLMEAIDDAHHETVSFHANGVGGPTMEAQIAGGAFSAVVDWSITEIADEVLGGVCSAGPSRLTTAGRLGLPQLVVPGGMDVVNFGAPDTMPEKYRGRLSFAHTAEATLMRTNPDENRRIAAVVAERLNAAVGPVEVVIPMLGFSKLSAPGGPIADPDADLTFADELEALLREDIAVSRVEAAINDPDFAAYVAERFAALRSDATHPQLTQ